MSDLSDFLLARIAEDEATARTAAHVDGPESRDWRCGGRRYHRFDNDRSESYEAVFAGNWDRILVARDDGSVATHIARQDPARVLAECEAKRRIVAMMRESYTENDVEYGALDDALRLLALPYADHPGYREEWRP